MATVKEELQKAFEPFLFELMTRQTSENMKVVAESIFIKHLPLDVSPYLLQFRVDLRPKDVNNIIIVHENDFTRTFFESLGM